MCIKIRSTNNLNQPPKRFCDLKVECIIVYTYTNQYYLW